MQYILRPSLKAFSLILLAGFMLVAGTCKKKNKKPAPELNTTLFRTTWIHSHEEDRGDTLVFRPNSYDFAPSRGRIGFSVDANGTFHQFDIAPTDGLEEHPGRWQMQSDNTFLVTFPNKKATDYTVQLLSVSPEKIKLKRIFRQ